LTSPLLLLYRYSPTPGRIFAGAALSARRVSTLSGRGVGVGFGLCAETAEEGKHARKQVRAVRRIDVFFGIVRFLFECPRHKSQNRERVQEPPFCGCRAPTMALNGRIMRWLSHARERCS